VVVNAQDYRLWCYSCDQDPKEEAIELSDMDYREHVDELHEAVHSVLSEKRVKKQNLMLEGSSSKSTNYKDRSSETSSSSSA